MRQQTQPLCPGSSQSQGRGRLEAREQPGADTAGPSHSGRPADSSTMITTQRQGSQTGSSTRHRTAATLHRRPSGCSWPLLASLVLLHTLSCAQAVNPLNYYCSNVAPNIPYCPTCYAGNACQVRRGVGKVQTVAKLRQSVKATDGIPKDASMSDV